MWSAIDSTPHHQFGLTADAAARQVGFHHDAQVARTVLAAGGQQRPEQSEDRSRLRSWILGGAVHLGAKLPPTSLT